MMMHFDLGLTILYTPCSISCLEVAAVLLCGSNENVFVMTNYKSSRGAPAILAAIRPLLLNNDTV